MDVRQVPVIDIGTLIGPSTDAEVDAALRDSKQQKLGQIVDSGNYADVGKENQIGDFKIHGPIDVANA
ncbi:hypothetical protein GN244_ATG19781 [Phytophthora infestans]|uniref:Uncharacterized protein n=1 Tax=Phytophthora infestans TaxID=4787 RepID=A0A833SU60_PHYIN|nr:hypothetical protein GN244_ATG19781 [Phytophthora infestans]